MLDIMDLHVASQPVIQHTADVRIRRLIFAARHCNDCQLHRLRESAKQFLRHVCVLERVMQQRNTLGSRIAGELTDPARHLDRMLFIRIAGAIERAVMVDTTKPQCVLHTLRPIHIVIHELHVMHSEEGESII